MEKKKEKGTQAMKELKDAMATFRKNVYGMKEICDTYKLVWLGLAIQNLVNVIDQHMEELK